MSSLVENRRYRQKHRTLTRRRDKKLSKHLGKTGEQTVEFNYVKTSLEILQSLIRNHRRWSLAGWSMTKLLHEPDEEIAKRSMMSAVFWPTLWDGIWKQFCVDLPRMRVHFENEIWKTPEALFTALEETVGPLWTRWLCVFLNQAPMSDVFSCVWKHVQHTLGAQFLICDGGFSTDMHIVASSPDELRLEIHKTFAIRSRASLHHPSNQVVKTRYEITFYPEMKIQLQWEYCE